MCKMLQTILYGTFVPPDVPGRVVSFDDVKWKRTAKQIKKSSASTRELAISALMSDPITWFTVHDIADMTGMHRDTAFRVLNRLASELIVAKRKAKLNPIGMPSTLFKWINKDAKKQKTS